MPQNDAPFVSVTIGPVDLQTDNDGKYIPSDDPTAIWEDYIITNRYEHDKHIYMLGLSSPNGFSQLRGGQVANANNKDTVAFAQLASSTLLWICDWTVQRTKERPKIPDPTPPDNWVLLDQFYEPHTETLGADGVTPIYRISGTYFYGHKRPTGDIMKLMNFPRPPWMVDFTDRILSTAMFERGLSTVERVLRAGGPNLFGG